jgi:hypothetical protein
MMITTAEPIAPKTPQERLIDELVERLATDAARTEEQEFELGTEFAAEVLHEREAIIGLK